MTRLEALVQGEDPARSGRRRWSVGGVLGVRKGRERVDRVEQRLVREQKLLGVFAHRAVGVPREEGDVSARVAKGGDHHHALGLAFASGGVHRATKARLVRVGRELGRGRAVKVRVAKLREIPEEGSPRRPGGRRRTWSSREAYPPATLPPRSLRAQSQRSAGGAREE